MGGTDTSALGFERLSGVIGPAALAVALFTGVEGAGLSSATGVERYALLDQPKRNCLAVLRLTIPNSTPADAGD